MPIYEYVCSGCGHKFELLRPFTRADEKTACPKCQKGARRAVSACFALSKGSGGETSPIAGTGGGCGSCGGSSCSTCGG